MDYLWKVDFYSNIDKVKQIKNRVDTLISIYNIYNIYFSRIIL